MNLGTFSGRIGRDIELRTTQSGEPVGNFALAVEVGTKAAPKVMWVDCTVWGKRAESLAQYLTKGTKITVAGRVTLEEFTKKDGTHGSKLLLTINDLDLHSRPEGSAPAAKPAANSLPDDDLPF